MAQDNDLRLRYGTWEQYLNGRWYEAADATQQWLSERYSGVTGTGNAQSFENIGYPETTTNRYTSRNEFTTSLLAAKEKGDLASPRDKPPEKSTRERFLEAWSEFSGGKRFPPYIENNPDFGLDGDVLRAFMTYFETVDPVASQPQSYTLDNGEVYTILPGGKVIKEGTKDPETGELIKTPGSSEVFVAEDGRSYIRQPDGTTELVPGEARIEWDYGLGRNIIRQPDGSIQVMAPEFDPRVVSQGGYNLLQQPSGALSQLDPLPQTPGVETIGGIQFIKTSTGELMPLDNVMKRMKENMVVTGDFEGAAAVHNWETRPSNQEYFDRMLQYVNAPADQLLVSAIARGQGLVAPPPEETIQRIGPPPEYLTEAFNMLRDQMQMGLPEGTQTFADIMAERAAELELEAAELANEAAQINNDNTRVAGTNANDAALIANQGARDALKVNAANSNLDLQDRLALSTDDPDESSWFSGGGGAGTEGTTRMQKFNQLRDEFKTAMGIPENVANPYTQGMTFDEMENFYTNVAPGIMAGLEEKPPKEEPPEEKPPKVETTPVPQAISSQMPTVARDPSIDVATFETFGPEEGGFERDEEPVAEPTPEVVEPTPPGDLDPGWLTSEEAAEVVAPVPTPAALAPGSIPEGGLQRDVAPSPGGFSQGAWMGASDEDDWFAGGGRYDDNTAIVGEEGPELAVFPRGTEIIPLNRRMRPGQARRLRQRGVRGMAEGGLVFGSEEATARGGAGGFRSLPGYQGDDPRFVTEDTLSRLRSGRLKQDPGDPTNIFDPDPKRTLADLPPTPTRPSPTSVFDSPLPLGIRQLQAGRSLGAPRGQLLRTAGLALPSAQARRRMLPSEREAFAGLGRMAGIPAEEFQQELGITTPSGAPRTGSARMLPLSLRR